MKKLALTLSLAAILTIGSTQAYADGVILGGLAGQPTQCEHVDSGVILGGLTEGQNNNGGKGVILGGVAGGCEEKGFFGIIWNSITGVISADD